MRFSTAFLRARAIRGHLPRCGDRFESPRKVPRRTMHARLPQAWKGSTRLRNRPGRRCQVDCTILHDNMAVSTGGGWLGLGRTLDSAGDAAGQECGIDDRTALDLLDAACNVATANQAACMRTMADRTGATVAGSRRVKAFEGRTAAARVGIALPPWWRLRLAARRTAAYQTAQDGPGSTPAGQG